MHDVPYGYCRCGCGQKTPLAPCNNRRAGWVKGKPLPRVNRAHNGYKAQHVQIEDRGYETPCWIWLLAKGHGGHGLWKLPGQQTVMAHRIYYERAKGPIPKELDLHHLCEQPSCVNPDHLEPLTRAAHVQRHTPTGLTWETVREMRRLRVEEGLSQRELGERFGVAKVTAERIVRGLTWKEPSSRPAHDLGSD